MKLRNLRSLTVAATAAAIAAAGMVSLSPTASAATDPISFVGATHAQLNFSSTKVVAVPPGTQAGDELLMFLNSAGPWSAPVGWTAQAQITKYGSTSTLYSKVATAADLGASVTLTPTGGKWYGTLTMADYHGVNTTKPLVVASKADSGTATHVTPEVVTAAGDWVVSYWSDKGTPGAPVTLPSSVTLRQSTFDTNPVLRFSSVIADSGKAIAAGTGGGVTATASSAPGNGTIMWTVAMAPGTGGTVPPQPLFQEDFSRVPVGAQPTAANTAYTTTIGDSGDETTGGIVVTAVADDLVGVRSAQFTNPVVQPSTYGFLGAPITAPANGVLYFERLYKIDKLPAYRTSILLFKDKNTGGTHIGSFAIGGTANSHKFVLVNGDTNSTTSSNTVPVGAWFRVRVKLDTIHHTQEASLFLGSNVLGTTPDEVITSPVGSTTLGFVEDGIETNPGTVIHVQVSHPRDTTTVPAPPTK